MATLPRVLLVLATLAAAAARAEPPLAATPFGGLGRALLRAMHATVVPCADPLDTPEVCFEVEATGVAMLAQEVEEVAVANAGAGLHRSTWTSGNGVHSLRLAFEDRQDAALVVYLAEVTPAKVHGVLRLEER